MDTHRIILDALTIIGVSISATVGLLLGTDMVLGALGSAGFYTFLGITVFGIIRRRSKYPLNEGWRQLWHTR